MADGPEVRGTRRHAACSIHPAVMHPDGCIAAGCPMQESPCTNPHAGALMHESSCTNLHAGSMRLCLAHAVACAAPKARCVLSSSAPGGQTGQVRSDPTFFRSSPASCRKTPESAVMAYSSGPHGHADEHPMPAAGAASASDFCKLPGLVHEQTTVRSGLHRGFARALPGHRPGRMPLMPERKDMGREHCFV